ncbi:uncharacterized protein LOC132736844 [Ruditapes philippinarum]|uniref:uncharacterized protein LOC132736844 n=1 Tax=Ruditapes philippinarum TaxID=129788 RepID=UPI00295AD0C3|nr:uncharacterized protein LOC132736844 [Ruditapes philippinarum]
MTFGILIPVGEEMMIYLGVTTKEMNGVIRLGAELDIYNGVPSLTGRYTATFDDTFATSVHGTVDTYGNWLVGAYLGWRFKRNAAGKKLYSVSFQIDPCNFITYDIDRNDEIVLGEMHAIFGDSEIALRLFIDMDENGNRVIEKEEFYNQAPQFIKECSVLDQNEGED